MISRGFETTDPITQTRLVVVQGAEDTAGRGWVVEVYCPQSAAPWVAAPDAEEGGGSQSVR